MAGLLQPYIPDASDWFSSAAKGYELGNTQRERDVLLEAGKAAAGGNMPMARRALYAGGNFAQARAIDAHSASLAAQTRAASNDQLARALKVQGALADVAHSINTPEEFEAAKATLGKAGLDVSKYNFGDLPALRAQALDIKTRLELSLKEKIASGKTNQELGEYEQKLRKEYSSLSSDARAIEDSLGRVKTGSKLNTGAGDIAVVYGYMKMLDPTSVVREGEYATAESAAGVPQQIVAIYNKILSGQRLTAAQRDQFINAADALAIEKRERQGKIQQQFETIARETGASPQRVILGTNADSQRGGGTRGPAVIRTEQEYMALPSGTPFIAPDGTERVKP